MLPCEGLEKDMLLREFITQYKRNKLIFPSYFNSSQSYDHATIIHLHSFVDIPADVPDSQPYIRYRLTYYNTGSRSFIGRTYVSQAVPVEKGGVVTKNKDSLLLTYSSSLNLNAVLEVTTCYVSKTSTTEEIGVGYGIIDISKPEPGKKTLVLYSGSPNFLLLKSQASSVII